MADVEAEYKDLILKRDLFHTQAIRKEGAYAFLESLLNALPPLDEPDPEQEVE